jgi:hypothetical protein
LESFEFREECLNWFNHLYTIHFRKERLCLPHLLFSHPIGAERLGGMLSLKEITGPVLANVNCHQKKEWEVHFRNSWNRAGVYFPFTELKSAQFYSRERKLLLIFGRTATIAITL